MSAAATVLGDCYLEETSGGMETPLITMRGPSDPLDAIEIGANKHGNSDIGQKSSDNNGKVIIDSVGVDFDLTPEVPGIKVDSALKNISIVG